MTALQGERRGEDHNLHTFDEFVGPVRDRSPGHCFGLSNETFPLPFRTGNMRPQTRPFTVETKSRRSLQSAQPNWGHLIDEPSPEELPSRDIREDISRPERDADPLSAANSVFSALARNAISTAASLGGLAASVFTPARPKDESPETTPVRPPPI